MAKSACRHAACRSTMRPFSVEPCNTVPCGQRRCTGASGRYGSTDAWTRRPSRSQASGPISIALWLSRGRPGTFSSQSPGTRRQRCACCNRRSSGTAGRRSSRSMAVRPMRQRFAVTTESTAIISRQVKYLSNIVEQDHRGVKRVTRPMLGFKSFEAAQHTLVGIELMHMIKKKQLRVEAGAESPTAAEQFYSLAV